MLELKPPFGQGFYEPKVTVDGQHLPAGWNTNVYTVPAGPHRLVVGTRHPVWDAQAHFVAEVTAEQRTVVHYTGPASKFTSGAMGYTEQPRPGRWVWFLIAGLILLIVVLALAIAWVAITFSQ